MSNEYLIINMPEGNEMSEYQLELLDLGGWNLLSTHRGYTSEKPEIKYIFKRPKYGDYYLTRDIWKSIFEMFKENPSLTFEEICKRSPEIVNWVYSVNFNNNEEE